MKSDLHPPQDGPGSDPILYGVAAALAALFPPVVGRAADAGAAEPRPDDDASEDNRASVRLG